MILGKRSRKLIAFTGLFTLSFGPVWADCMSAASSPEWPDVVRSIAEAQLCEQLPVGPNRTQSFRVVSADVCSEGGGISTVRAKALLTCESEPGSLFEMGPVEGEVLATVSLDIGACRITNSRIVIGGDIGGLLSDLPDTQDFARKWAQSQLTRLCHLR